MRNGRTHSASANTTSRGCPRGHPISWRLPASVASGAHGPLGHPGRGLQHQRDVARDRDDPERHEQAPLPVVLELGQAGGPVHVQLDVDADTHQPNQAEHGEGDGGGAVDVGSGDLHGDSLARLWTVVSPHLPTILYRYF